MRGAPQLLNRFRTPSRYVQVAILCALINNIAVIAADYLGFHYAVGLVAAFILGNGVGYVLHAGYTFRTRRRLGALGKFYGATLVGFCWTALLIAALCDGLGLRAALAMPIVTVVLFAWNYLTARWAVLERAA